MGPINENKSYLLMIGKDGSYSENGKIEVTATIVDDSETSDLSNIKGISSFSNNKLSFSGKAKLPLWLKLFFLKLRIKNKFRKILMRHSPSKEWQNIYKEEN